MPANLEVFFAPAEFAALTPAALTGTDCIVFDVLRATTSMVTALENGAIKVFPVKEIADALELKRRHPSALLAGERDGLRIRAAQTGSIDFDLGNSPREFTTARVAGREIIMTTTNGTRALQGCAGARHILAGAVLNLSALASWVQKSKPRRLLIICAGTFEETAYEDVWAAGALCDLIWAQFKGTAIADSAQIARDIYRATKSDTNVALQHSRNARRLLSDPELRDDVAFAFRTTTIDLIGGMTQEAIERMPQL